jgi:hypothetical protein
MDIWEWYQQQPATVKITIISGIFVLLNNLLAALLNPSGPLEMGAKDQSVDGTVSIRSPSFRCGGNPAICRSLQVCAPDCDLLIVTVNIQVLNQRGSGSSTGIVEPLKR